MGVLNYIQRLTCQLEVNKRFLSNVQPAIRPTEVHGDRLGCDLQQHEAAFELALQDPPRPYCQAQDAAKLVEEVEQLLDTTKGGRSDLNTARSLLAMNIFLEQQLASPSPLLTHYHADFLQRKLAANLPAATKLLSTAQPDGTDSLRCRCAIAKGRHRVEYSGHPAACQLLALLAAQNHPSIKAVLRLPADPSIKPTTSPSDCRGEFELNFDVRGTFVAQHSMPRPINEVNEDDIFRVVAEAEIAIRKRFDTFAFAVAPEGTGAALALEVCYMVMQHLQQDGRGACIVVRRHPDSPSRSGKFTVALAELDLEVRGMALLNTPRKSAATQVLLRGIDLKERRQQRDIHERIEAMVHASDLLYEGVGAPWRENSIDAVISRMASSGPQITSNRLAAGLRKAPE